MRKERPEARAEGERFGRLDVKKYLDDPEYRRSAEKSPAGGALVYYETVDWLSELFRDEKLGLARVQTWQAKLLFLDELAKIYPFRHEFVHPENLSRYDGKTIRDMEEEMKVRIAHDMDSDSMEKIKEENLESLFANEVRLAREKTALNLDRFVEMPVYRAVWRESNLYLGAISAAIRIAAAKKLIAGTGLDLDEDQIRYLDQKIGAEFHEAAQSPAEAAASEKIRRRADAEGKKIMSAFEKIKEEYLRGAGGNDGENRKRFFKKTRELLERKRPEPIQ